MERNEKWNASHVLFMALFPVMLVGSLAVVDRCLPAVDEDVREVVVTDTIRDTIVVEKPMLVAEQLVRHDTIRVKSVRQTADFVEKLQESAYDGENDSIKQNEICLTDSVDVEIPITQQTYEGENYKAWVSGFHTSLDSLHIYMENYETTRTITRTIREKQKRFGVSVGVGYGFNGTKMQPYVGMHVGYTLLRF